jgi:hypothetical protein
MAWYGRDYGEGGWGGGYNPRDTGWSGGSYYGGDRGWSGRGYQDEGLGGRFAGRRRPHHERTTFGPRDEYDHDMGDQLREGWRDLKRGVRRAFGGGYDQGYHGGRHEEDRFHGGRHGRERWGSEAYETGPTRRGRGFGDRGWGADEMGERGWTGREARYGAPWQGSSRGYRTGRWQNADENRYW